TSYLAPSVNTIRKGRNGDACRNSSYCRSFSMRQWYPPGLSAFNRNPHRPRRSRDDLGGGVFVEGVEVFALLLGDRFALGHADFADLVLVRLAAAFLGLHRVLQKHAR